MTAPTDAQLIEHARNTCVYFTTDRTRAIEWPHLIHKNEEAFAEMCGKSETVFLRNSAWADIIASPYFTSMFDPIVEHRLVVDGNLGSMCGCKFVTDAFCTPVAKDPAPDAIYFVPREV